MTYINVAVTAWRRLDAGYLFVVFYLNWTRLESQLLTSEPGIPSTRQVQKSYCCHQDVGVRVCVTLTCKFCDQVFQTFISHKQIARNLQYLEYGHITA